MQLIQSKFEELYGDVNPGGSGLGSNTSFSSRMDFGGPRNLGNEPIMKVQVAAPLQEPYWRWESKDIYASNGWESLADEVFEQDVTKPDLPVTNRIVRRPVKQLFTNLRPRQDMLFYAPDVVSSNIEMWVRQIRLPDGSIQVTTLQPLLRLDEGDQYEMTSMQVAATEADLRAASVRTSSTIETIYLQLPSSVTPRTRQLAIDITAGLNNDYDKAIAIRDYLRTNIRYNDQIAAPPSGVDPVDYLLFELGEGYCDYYATAMAVLLRSVGVPSRISRGYASGSYAPHPSGSYGTYTVLEKDAHSWPEVYFEGHGWVIFEPTSAYNTINRESGETADAEPTAELATPTSERTKTPTPSPEKADPANPEVAASLGNVADLLCISKYPQFALYLALILSH